MKFGITSQDTELVTGACSESFCLSQTKNKRQLPHFNQKFILRNVNNPFVKNDRQQQKTTGCNITAYEYSRYFEIVPMSF